METIDWSKAPEGAEFWNPNSELFYRSLDGEFQKFSETRGRWTIAAGERHEYQTLIAKPTPWNGEGLPPVGTVCEWRPNQDDWVQVEILGHDGEETWFRRAGQSISETCLRMAFFRPIRTPEQIAAEERETAVAQMLSEVNYAPWESSHYIAMAERLYDAGYRKQADQ